MKRVGTHGDKRGWDCRKCRERKYGKSQKKKKEIYNFLMNGSKKDEGHIPPAPYTHAHKINHETSKNLITVIKDNH